MFSCSKCAEHFSTNSNKLKHERNMHSEAKEIGKNKMFEKSAERPYGCSICSMFFTTVSNKNRHENDSHLNVFNKLVDCSICKKSFASKGNLKLHMNLKHKFGNKDCLPASGREKLQNIRQTRIIKKNTGLQSSSKKIKKKEPNRIATAFIATDQQTIIAEAPVTPKRRSERLMKFDLKPETRPPSTLNKTNFLKTLNLRSTQPDYEHIDQNEIINEPPKQKLTSKCNCKPKNGCGDTCLNRLTSVECHPKKCSAKTQCRNQHFRNGSSYQTEIRLTEKKGYGLFAMEHIPIGEFVCEYVGQVISSDEFKIRFEKSVKTGKFYYMSLEEGSYIDSGQKGNKSRFANHSCDPNAQARKWTVDKQNRIGLFAIKNIQRDEEIVFDYDYSMLRKIGTKCECGSRKCRKIIW